MEHHIPAWKWQRTIDSLTNGTTGLSSSLIPPPPGFLTRGTKQRVIDCAEHVSMARARVMVDINALPTILDWFHPRF